MSKRRVYRKNRPISAALIEPLELRALLSAILPNPIAYPLLNAVPADGSLADGSTTPPASAYSPAQIKSAYGISNIKLSGVVGDGSGQTIAIVTAFDDPALVSSTSANFAGSDLHIFDKQFGLPDPSFTKVEQTPGMGSDTGWSEEAALDVEWTHAIAPAAKIVLFEASGAGAVQLLDWGVSTAAHYAGVSVVTTSFGFGEFSSETSYDTFFTTPSGHSPVTFVASTGDNGAPGIYPAFSPNVVAVGGTHLAIVGSSYQSESAYSGSGGGVSSFESKPSYQSSETQDPFDRTIPDVAFDGDPNTGVDVYDSNNGGFPGWYKIAGTSFSAPAWAGLIAIADQGRASAGLAALDGRSQTLPKLYSLPALDFHDITSGNNGFAVGPRYDLVTGRGTPIAHLLVPGLAGVSSTGPATASISGTIYTDANSNGKLDSGETGLAGVKLYVDTHKNGAIDSGEPTFTTTSTGAYTFSNLPAGATEIREVLPSGYKLTRPTVGFYNITLTAGQKVTGENFGNAKVTTALPGSIAGTAFLDANGNGILDSGESGFSARIYMDINKNGIFDSNEPSYPTSSNGVYKLNGIPAGTYELREVLPSGYRLTDAPLGYIQVTVGNGAAVTGVNFGNAKVTSTTAKTIGSISGFVYVDANSNGKLDTGEKPLAGVTMFIDTNHDGKLDNGETFTITDSAGYYYLGVTTASTFRVVEIIQSGYHLTNPTAGFYDIQVNGGWNVKNENWGNLL
jgi:hypothetical protein